MTGNHYNLVDEPWIPVADVGLVSLRDVFERENLRALGGTPVQKIALLKLFAAITQAACTPEDDTAWAQLGVQGTSNAVLEYLQRWYDSFWLYGQSPFLQMPAVQKADLQSYGALMPEVASGNATVLTQWQHCPSLTHADKALLLLVNMSLCFGGKKADKECILTPGQKKSSAKSGPALCHMGLLHTFLTGASLRETVWLNLQVHTAIKQNKLFAHGLGVAPWEDMPKGEACQRAEQLKASFMGRLVPLARFCLLEEQGLRYVEGIQHPDYLQGSADPSVSLRETGKKNQVLWCDPAKRPWRSLTALLSFLKDANASDGFVCPLLRWGIPRLGRGGVEQFGIWSGGIRVSSTIGEQYLTGTDDMVESEILLDVAVVHGEQWFQQLQLRMAELEAVGKALYVAVVGYFKAMKAGAAEEHGRMASHLFWQLAERHFQSLVDACNEDAAQRSIVMRRMLEAAQMAFDLTCPKDTARQIQNWAQHKPRLGKILAEQ